MCEFVFDDECEEAWSCGSGNGGESVNVCGGVMLVVGEVAITAAAARFRLAQLAAFADMHMPFKLMFFSFSLIFLWKICANLGSLCLGGG